MRNYCVMRQSVDMAVTLRNQPTTISIKRSTNLRRQQLLTALVTNQRSNVTADLAFTFAITFAFENCRIARTCEEHDWGWWTRKKVDKQLPSLLSQFWWLVYFDRVLRWYHHQVMPEMEKKWKRTSITIRVTYHFERWYSLEWPD